MSIVLLVEDDLIMSDVVATYLRREGHEAHHLADGTKAAAWLRDPRRQLDLAILDLMLPGTSGQDLCLQIRAERPGVPILMLTALAEEEDRIAGFRMGADDYVTKPFSPRELMLRVGSILRRTSAAPPTSIPSSLRVGPVTIDTLARRVTRTDEETGARREVALTTREYDVLTHLALHAGEALTREDLLRDVWGWSYGDLSTVTVHVRRIRAKVERDPARPTLISTVWGVGYRLEATA